MKKTNAERVLDYILTVSPDGVTNAQIRHATGIEPHQQIFAITRDLAHQGKVRRLRSGHEWFFYATEGNEVFLESSEQRMPEPSALQLTPFEFEELARRIFSQRFGVDLASRQIEGVHKKFDFVSADEKIIGDAKYYTLVRGTHFPPAKFSNIAEHVWLLEKTNATIKFLVFGNDSKVPKQWLERYGNLRENIAFYFLTDSGDVEEM